MYEKNYTESSLFGTAVLNKNLGQEIYVKKDTRALTAFLTVKRILTWQAHDYVKNRQHIFQSGR